MVMANKSKTNKVRVDLSALPMTIKKQSRYWYLDSKNGTRIHVSQLYKLLPKPPINEEEIINKRWDLRY